MAIHFRSSQTATGRWEFIAGDPCDGLDFPARAQEIVEQFQLSVSEKISQHDDTQLWIVSRGDAIFCISWDHWFQEVSIMAWSDTPDLDLQRLIDTNRN